MENGEILLYQAEDGVANLQVRLENETVWLTQDQMATLFQKSKSTINEHIQHIFEEGELQESLVMRKFGISEFSMKPTNFYNLDVIISVGYRVKSSQGTQFRIWATQRLKEYLVKGFTMNDAQLAKGNTDYFEELVRRVRAIRASEKHFYQKVKDIFATSIDYDGHSEHAEQFYKIVQNKFHYAIHGHTAAELIVKRIDSTKPNMGLTNWTGKVINTQDAQIAQNYLEALELKRLELLVEQFLSFAELRSVERKPMYMTDWIKKLDEFLVLNEKEILQNAGTVSHKVMEKKVRAELAKYRQQLQERNEEESDT